MADEVVRIPFFWPLFWPRCRSGVVLQPRIWNLPPSPFLLAVAARDAYDRCLRFLDRTFRISSLLRLLTCDSTARDFRIR